MKQITNQTLAAHLAINYIQFVHIFVFYNELKSTNREPHSQTTAVFCLWEHPAVFLHITEVN